jgi:hypothetical protein
LVYYFYRRAVVLSSFRRHVPPPPPARHGYDCGRRRRRTFAFDRRTLGLTRLLLGFYLLCDLVHRGRWWEDFFSSEGVCPNRWSVAKAPAWGYFSLFHAFSTAAELRVLFAAMLVTFVALLVHKTGPSWKDGTAVHYALYSTVKLFSFEASAPRRP